MVSYLYVNWKTHTNGREDLLDNELEKDDEFCLGVIYSSAKPACTFAANKSSKMQNKNPYSSTKKNRYQLHIQRK